jgi:hypothetical protein
MSIDVLASWSEVKSEKKMTKVPGAVLLAVGKYFKIKNY